MTGSTCPPEKGSVVDGLDAGRDGALHAGDSFRGVAFQVTQDDDPVVLGLVAVVEDEVVAGGVVADVAHVGICSGRLSLQGER